MHAVTVAFLKNLGGLLELPVFAQLANEVFAYIFCLVEGLGRARQEGAGLEEEQAGGDGQKGRQLVGSGLLHQLQVRQILVCDLSQGNGRDVQFLLLDEVQQEVERPLKGG